MDDERDERETQLLAMIRFLENNAARTLSSDRVRGALLAEYANLLRECKDVLQHVPDEADLLERIEGALGPGV